MSTDTDLRATGFRDGLVDTIQVHSLRQHPILYGPFKNKNRTRLGILSQLLELSRDNCLKTHLMFGANLSFRAVSRYLDILVEHGLVTETSDRNGTHRIYKISDKGVDFLNTYYLLESFLSQEQQK